MKKTLLSLAIASLAAGQSVCAAVEKVYNCLLYTSLPRFSWQMESLGAERGLQQPAYQIIVSDEKGNIVWDSGKTQKAVLTATADAADAVLSVCPQLAGKYALDMVSLFPQNRCV